MAGVDQSNVREAASKSARRAIVEAARDLRRRQTLSESLLWWAVRNRQLDGRKFRRQSRIGHYVVDFYCPTERLIVEVDGGVHAQQLVADRDRQEELESMGLRVLRVTASEVEQDIERVLSRIRGAFIDVGRADELPSPSQRERGRG